MLDEEAAARNEWLVKSKVPVGYSLPEESWRGVATSLTPSAYANCQVSTVAPEASLEMSWIYGYQSEKAKNNLRYTSAKGHCIVYHVGRFGIVYSFDSHKQTIFSGHRNEIISLAIHPDGELVATGDSHLHPTLLVWNSVTKKVLFSDRGFHQNGIIHTAFSHDGKQLASVGLDIFHTVAVHLWEDNSLLYSSQVDKGRCMSCNFLSDVGNTLAVGGDSYVYLWSKSDEGYSKRRANFSRHVRLQPITAICHVDVKDSFVCGTISGILLMFTDRNCVRNVKGHMGSVTAIYSCQHGLVTGGKDERIRLWTHTLEPGATFDMAHFGLGPQLRSVCLSMDGSSILLGTKGAEIYEISAIDGSDLRGGACATGHSSGLLRNIVVHPSRMEFASVGDDNCLRIWDTITRSLLKVATFDGNARAVAYGPLGDVLCVGLGDSVKDEDDDAASSKNGAFVILNEEDLSVIHEAKDSNTPISCCLYSPEGETLAVAAEDGAIFLYAVHDDYELVGRCIRHTSPVMQMDFSLDGEWLRSNGSNGDLLYFNSDDASLQSNAAAMRDVKWSQCTSLFSWHVKGVHNCNFLSERLTTSMTPPVVMERLNADDANSTINKSSPFDFAVFGSNLGYVNIYPFPCTQDNSEYHRMVAHTGPVAQLRFSANSQIMISCGLEDRCIIQWKCIQNIPPVLEAPKKDMEEEDGAVVEEVPKEEDGVEEKKSGGIKMFDSPIYNYHESEDFALEMRGASDIGEDFMVEECDQVSGLLTDDKIVKEVKKNSFGTADDMTEKEAKAYAAKEAKAVWLESTVEPNNPPLQRTAAPDITMRLDYVYGYRCQDMRNNIRYTEKDSIVYPAATIGVVMDRMSKAQKYFHGHSQQISSFAVSRCGKYVASGEIGHKPRISVWSAVTTKALQVISDFQEKSVIGLEFSNTSDLLAVVGLDKDHSVSIYDWKQGILLCRCFSGCRRIIDICFSPDDQYLLSCGIREVRTFKIDTWSLASTKLMLVDGGMLQPYLCCTYFAGYPTVGTTDGHLYVFDGNSLHHVVKAHTGPIHAIHVSHAGDQMVTGGKDGLVKLWNQSLDCIKEFSVDAVLPVSQPTISHRVRSVCFSRDDQFLLVGTRGAEIFEIRISNASMVGSRPILQAHGYRELHGLATHPVKEEFVTAGDDCTIRLWDSKASIQVKCIRMDSPSRSICYSPDGRLVAVGFGCGGKKGRSKSTTKDGSFVVLSANELKLVHEGKDTNEAIRFVKFSADSKVLAVGSDDGKIYCYNVRDHYSRRCTMNCHRAPLLCCDFSADGQFLMSIDITKRICFSETTSGAHIPSPAAVRDTKWSTWSSPVGWYSKGLWDFQPLGAEPCSVQRSWGGSVLASGNTDGRIFLVHNPCQELAGFVGDAGHAGPIAGLHWLAGDSALISIGSKDHTILQWKCLYDTARESGDEGGISCDDSELDRDGGNEELNSIVKNKADIDEESEDFITGAQMQGWMANVAAPSHLRDDNVAMPDLVVEPDHVHGVRSGDSRQSLRYNDDGNLVFFSAQFGIVYDRKEHVQHIYEGHQSPIISLDVGVNKQFAATGELGFNPEVHIWDARTATKLSTVKDIHRHGVISVSFSPSGYTLATLGQDRMHSVVVLRSCTKRWINDVFVEASVNVSVAKMYWVLHVEDSSQFPIIAGGNRCIYFFKKVGKSLQRSKGTFGRRRKLQSILCGVEVMFSDANTGGVIENDDVTGAQSPVLLTGTVTGHVYVWKNQRIQSTLTAHEAPVFCIAKLNDFAGGRFVTAGKDGLVKTWSESLQMIQSFNMQGFTPSPYLLSCHDIAVNNTSSKISVVLRSGEIYEITLATRSHFLLLEAHSHKQLHGLCMNPHNKDEYCTVGDDGVVRVWSLEKRRCMRRTALEVAGRACAWSPDGSQIAVGIGGDPSMSTKDGAIIILQAATLDVMFEDRKAKYTISDMKYSPSGSMLAVASRDGKVYIHDAQSENGSLEQFCLLSIIELVVKESYVTHIDFNLDSSIIRFSTSTFDLLHYSISIYPHSDTTSIPLATTVRDEKWYTTNVPYGWLTKGVWKAPSDHVDVCSIDVIVTNTSGRGGYIAVTYDDGEVRLFNNPCQNIGNQSMLIKGNSSFSPNARFSLCGKYLIVLDACARSIIQYRLISKSDVNL